MAALLCRTSLGGIIIGGVHRHEGRVDGFSAGAVLYLSHRRRRVLAAWRSGTYVTDIDDENTRGGGTSDSVGALMAGLEKASTSIYTVEKGSQKIAVPT